MANNRTLTSADCTLLLSVASLFDTPQRIQGFSTDDITDTDPQSAVQTAMGIDGRLSFGYTPQPTVQNITLQADSLSNDLFELVAQQMRLQRQVYIWSGTLIVPSTQRKYTMTRGALTSFPPTPSLKATIQPRRYAITWESVSPAPKV